MLLKILFQNKLGIYFPDKTSFYRRIAINGGICDSNVTDIIVALLL